MAIGPGTPSRIRTGRHGRERAGWRFRRAAMCPAADQSGDRERDVGARRPALDVASALACNAFSNPPAPAAAAGHGERHGEARATGRGRAVLGGQRRLGVCRAAPSQVVNLCDERRRAVTPRRVRTLSAQPRRFPVLENLVQVQSADRAGASGDLERYDGTTNGETRPMGKRSGAGLSTAAVATAAAAIVLAMQAAAGQAPATYDLTLAAVDGTTKILGRLPATVLAPRVSPDGQEIAFDMRDPESPDGGGLWVAPISNLDARRSVPGTGAPLNGAPLWTPDGERLLFLASGSRADAIFWRRADGTGDAEHLLDARGVEAWTAPHAFCYLTLAGNADYGIAQFDVMSRTSTTLVDRPGSAQHSCAASPDRRWLAYASNETGRYEVWLTPLPPTAVRYRLTGDGGTHPIWLPDGRSLYFYRDRQLFSLTLNLDGPAPVGGPRRLPIKGFAQTGQRRQFDLMPNGREFLVLMPAASR